MECPRCGYVLDPLDVSCPKCAFLDQTQVIPAMPVFDPNAAQAPGPTQRYVIPPLSPAHGAARSRLLVQAFAAVAGLVLFLVVGLVWARLAATVTPGLSLVQGWEGPGGGLGTAAVDSDQIQTRLGSAQATTGGDVEVSLAWNALSDLDLQVQDPSGELINAHHPHSASGGVQDVDANCTLVTEEGARLADSGQNPGPSNVLPLPDFLVDLDEKMGMPGAFDKMPPTTGLDGKAMPRFTRKPVEHVYFAKAPKGAYTVYAHCYSWREPNRTPLPFTIEVRSHGSVFYQTSGTIGPENYITDNTVPTVVCRFDMR